jgi:hypothetical protein
LISGIKVSISNKLGGKGWGCGKRGGGMRRRERRKTTKDAKKYHNAN